MHRDDVSLRFGMPARGSRIPRFEDETSASEAELSCQPRKRSRAPLLLRGLKHFKTSIQKSGNESRIFISTKFVSFRFLWSRE